MLQRILGRCTFEWLRVKLSRGFKKDPMSKMRNNMRMASKRSVVLLVSILSGCISKSDSGIVARVEDWILTEARLADLLVLAQPFPLDSVSAQDLARHWVRAAAIAQLSSRSDLLGGEEVVGFSTSLERDEAILQQEREDRLGAAVAVDSSTAQHTFREGSYRLLAHVLRRVGAETPPEEIALQRRTAQRILDGLLAGGGWSGAVAESEDLETTETGGLIGLLGRGELPAQLDRVAFQLQPGQVSSVTATSQGFHILYRPQLEEVFDLYALRLRERLLDEAEDKSNEGLLVERGWLRSSDGIISVRAVVADPFAGLGADSFIGSWEGGTLLTSVVARYVLALPLAARHEMITASEESLGVFVEQLALREIRLKDARERGLELSQEILDQLEESHRADVQQWYRELGVDEITIPERLQLNQYMEGVVSRRSSPATIGPLFESWLLEQVDWALIESNVPNALLGARNLIEAVGPA